MSSLAFVYLARAAGPTFEDLADDIAGLTRPGDHVLIVEDSGTADTPARIGRFTEQVGWGADVAVTTILTGAAGAGDLGVAINLALDALSVPGAGRDRVVFWPAGARIDGAAFAAARAQAEAGDLDVLALPLRQWSLDLGRVIDGPDLDGPDLDGPDLEVSAGSEPLSHARSLHPGLDGMILRWPLPGAAQGRCAEGQSSFGDLGLWWQALHSAARIGVTSAPAGHRPHPADPDAALFRALTDLAGQDPQASAWISRSLPRLLAGVTPGAITGLRAAVPALLKAMGDDADTALLRGFEAGTRGARQGLRQATGSKPVAPEQSLLTAPDIQPARAPLTICVTGKHSHRQPFAYAALAPLWQEAISVTTQADKADLIVIAHPHNLIDLPADLARAAAGGTPIALISEEPFWDTLFSPDPLARAVTLPAAHLGTVSVHQVTHHRSPIFAFDRIPYFLLTDPGYIRRYGTLFARNAALTAQDWASAFDRCTHDVTFMAERRPEAFHDMTFAGGDIVGLCAWRTRLAIGCTKGRVQRLGASWGHGPSRFDLTDWHADKIAQMDGQTRILSGLENTHQPTYLSEKLFDAFACGARPLYHASPGHRTHDLGLPEGAWINLWGLSSEAAVERVEAAPWDSDFYSDYAAAQSRLAALFTDADILAAERTRLGRALIGEVTRLVGCGPA